MEIILLLLFLLLIILIIGIPIGTALFIDRYIKRKKYHPKWRLLALLPIFLFSYWIYISFYPGNDFYQTDFKQVTGMEFPHSADIKYKTASFPDHFGDYTSVALIEVGPDFYNNLPKNLLDHGLKENEQKLSDEQLNKVLEQLDGKELTREFSVTKDSGVYFYVAFLSDNNSIIVQRTSW